MRGGDVALQTELAGRREWVSVTVYGRGRQGEVFEGRVKEREGGRAGALGDGGGDGMSLLETLLRVG